ncbi:MAG TPA: Asp-tRNA(Asn)/Glu-tRNA(Gln) amidotransferase subunit GatC [Alphaproteobacteria bacterium]|jgi:aspartyl-tRNA(Asn)/glutamyl-tRNA(Gln) amidotransferase subunit C|nr:Asp-tRNA(Asn)/Glu-tRNA(Gln) amidotransferase subunit GatC [Alphaproteobacteria bacterium]MDP6268959.1 Asp-tRNA(Asn)/Glu-tRNA(Gln) amidotransferase subunit GatC [Alphaproteobacteria bacterium]MDP7427786.1 Asp-tRNA(Asn)/Glu-tRNA(Gln) amidotransferase subunit GatC [Alphaproteobacteria bacterium]HJM49365.1 Asp-tRNA(Asn)/Glu-tRNA(Gln) amidotransferase subunit GatC [Alphaproteobacteria bacterium]
MALDKKTVAHIAHLARLRLGEDELEALAGELSNIITWVEQLDEVDTQDVAPMASVAEMTLRWRDDVVDDGAMAEKVVANAPERRESFFAVPKVVE